LYPFATNFKASEYLGTLNIKPIAFINYKSTEIFALFHLSAQRYNIFWGAPAHLIGYIG
jgi:hypothetical protein